MNRENQEWMKKILAVLAIVIIGILLFHIVSVASFNQHEYKVQAPMGIGNATRVVAGPLMILHEIYLALLLIWILAILVLSVKRKGTYSKPDFYIYLLLPSGAFLTYIFETVMLPVISSISFWTRFRSRENGIWTGRWCRISSVPHRHMISARSRSIPQS